ncbi:protein argonaute 16 isoform X2 [Henckelia pumila]|uniref:protein argonaute 16 isoform X2 n=1 Tax=Henckelia pumila TaxID=405737 RepID=UPI003C6DE1E5
MESPALPPNANLQQAALPKRSVIDRTGFGTSGRPISLLANHFKVSLRCPNEIFYQYSVSISSEDNGVVDNKGIGRKIAEKLYQTYSSEFAGKTFAYDGEKCLYTVGPLPQNTLELTVILEESIAKHPRSPSDYGDGSGSGKRSKHSLQSKAFKVEISYVAKIPLKSISLALQGAEAENVQDGLRVLDVILRQKAANKGCLLVRQSFFHDDTRTFSDVGGGVAAVKGFYSSFRPTHGGLSLNMDVSSTMILKPGPVVDFLLANQNLKDRRNIDWDKAKRMLKNLRVKARHNNREFKIIGLSEKPCNQQFFSLKVKNGGNARDDVSLQRYKKALSGMQRASLVEQSRQKPPERIRVVTDAVRNYQYDDDPLLISCGISIEKQLTQVDGRVLDVPKLKVGNGEDFFPRNGRWNFNNKKVLNPCRIECWSLVNFSARCDTSHLSRELINCGRNKGIHIERPYTIIEEDPQCSRASPFIRVERMFEQIMAKLPGPPEFLLCILPERKNSAIYGPWKKKCLTNLGIVTQCTCPSKINDQYLTNLLLKINSKLGGTNSLLALEHSRSLPLINDKPTLIIGMDVSHGSPGQSDIPSIAAVVGSRSWPLISRYRAAVRTQSPKVEMIESLYKPLENGEDDGIIRELLLDFYQTSNKRKPSQIIVFRDGVSESQFSQVLNIELDQIVKAYQHLGEVDVPKFTVVVAQKRHHTQLFQASAPENVPPGTVVDTKVVHPRNYDFYLCAQAGMIGTSRPAHYHVLLNEIGFSPDDLQNLVHSLSYVYQRSTTAVSIVAPICYAHLAAQQIGQFLKFEDSSETSSGQKSMSTAVPQLPRLHSNVAGSMFFC